MIWKRKETKLAKMHLKRTKQKISLAINKAFFLNKGMIINVLWHWHKNGKNNVASLKTDSALYRDRVGFVDWRNKYGLRALIIHTGKT